MPVLSIQSHVARGHVGNAAATLPLQLLGFEVWPVNTTAMSNHPGAGDWRGRICPAAEVTDILDGLLAGGRASDCEAVLSGYLGEPETGEAVLDAVAAVRAMSPDAPWCCDPVMGDLHSGFYVRPGLPEFFRERALPRADILCPNPFELAWLAERPVTTPEEALVAARALCDMGAGLVVATGLAAPAGHAMIAVSADAAWRIVMPRPDGQAANDDGPEAPVHGAGDLFAALFLGHLLRRGAVPAALEGAAAGTAAVVGASLAAGSPDLLLVAARAALAEPPPGPPAEPVTMP